jgi:hypothetical protein
VRPFAACQVLASRLFTFASPIHVEPETVTFRTPLTMVCKVLRNHPLKAAS